VTWPLVWVPPISLASMYVFISWSRVESYSFLPLFVLRVS
jgi:hypothetical protein